MSEVGGRPAARPLNILIILMGSLGDVARGLSVVDFIKARAPESKISWIVEPACEQLVGLHSGVDRVIVFNRKKWLSGFLSLRKILRGTSYDVTLDLQRHFKSGIFSLISRAPRRIGFHRRDSKEFNWIFNNEHVSEQGERLPKLRHYQLFIEKLGIPSGEKHPTSALRATSLSTLDREYREQLPGPYVALVLGSSWDSKDWPEEGYHQLVKSLSTLKMVLIALLGDHTKTAMAERLLATAGSPRVVNMVGKTDLRALVGLLQGASVVIGPDSGPAHIAGALGKPHITLFGPTPIERNTPVGSEDLTISSRVGCSPCRRRFCPGLSKICMRLITAEAVMERVRAVLTPS